MNWARAEKIADAVLYEGYLLYPYRPSAIKNRQRWNFGVVYPQAHSEAQTCDPWTMQTECLVQGESGATVQVRVRCLQLSLRSIGELATPVQEVPEHRLSEFRAVERLTIGDKVFQSWQEAVVQEVTPPPFQVGDLANAPLRQGFHFPAGRTFEELRDDRGQVVGMIIRERGNIDGFVETAPVALGNGVYKLAVTIRNVTGIEATNTGGRESVLMHSMLSAHTILCAENGQFVSLLEPSDEMTEFAGMCQNANTWPVLVGENGSRDVMLSSPIILYDYPQIAPESPGDLFDGTEIDEILALRIMTMTDEEKKEVREADPRGRELLERTETLPPEHLMKLHGVLRGLRPSGEAS